MSQQIFFEKVTFFIENYKVAKKPIKINKNINRALAQEI